MISPDSTAFAAALIHFHKSTVVGFYWAATGVAFLNGVLCLLRLKQPDGKPRLFEKHHLFWGAILVLATLIPGFPTGLAWTLRLLGTEMIVDDSINHSMQVVDLTNGKTPRPDWTWDHKIGVWIMNKLGWKS